MLSDFLCADIGLLKGVEVNDFVDKLAQLLFRDKINASAVYMLQQTNTMLLKSKSKINV